MEVAQKEINSIEAIIEAKTLSEEGGGGNTSRPIFRRVSVTD